MNTVFSKFTVFFEDPFWVGVYEVGYDDSISIYKLTFGSEPKDYEVYYYLLKNYNSFRFSSKSYSENNSEKTKINPKRLQRLINKELKKHGISTKSQEILKKQQEEFKTEKKKFSKKEAELERKRKFILKQEKKHDKKRGH